MIYICNTIFFTPKIRSFIFCIKDFFTDNYEDNPGFFTLPNGQVQCPICQKCLSNMTVAKTHFKSVHDDVKVNCQLCTRSFKNAWYRDRHIKADHGISPKGLDLKKIIKYEETSGFLPLPNGQAQCLKCQKILSNMTVAKTHYKGWIMCN